MLVSTSIAGWVAYYEPGFSNAVGISTIYSGAPYPLCSFVLDLSLFALVAPARRKSRRVTEFLLFGFGSLLSFLFISWGMEWAAGRARRRERRFLF
ncbi:hypothetical protein [Paracoccus sp. (in: a-proteobacteria)]|uniref:hypothetical protein n=1 Tax=Paracoccus sp. TaxID=267 RepID=UPI002AFFEFEB|nr:hypothetical protein [Paracoccus sp. (in: a-proteobacteria)]